MERNDARRSDRADIQVAPKPSLDSDTDQRRYERAKRAQRIRNRRRRTPRGL